MRSEEIVGQCLRETGADKISDNAGKVALVAMIYAPPADMRKYRRQIKDTFKQSGEYGSIFILIVLPILISLISAWLTRWIWSTERTATQILRMRAQAFDTLKESSPRLVERLTFTNSQTILPGRPEQW